MAVEPLDLATFLAPGEVTVEAVERYADAAHASFVARERFNTLVNEYRAKVEQGQGEVLKLALGLFIVGRFAEALEQFARGPRDPLRHWYAGEAAATIGRWSEAVKQYEQAAERGWDAFAVDMRIAAVQVEAGDVAAAEQLVQRHAAHGPDRAEWHYVRGLLAEQRDDRVAAGEAYEKALTLAPEHTQALFRAARLFDLLGDDDRALDCYDQLTRQPRAWVNALINAAVVYEDMGHYGEAIICLRRVLKAYPNHTRARLFLKDVESSRTMVIDESGEQRVDARARLLEMPLTEFELSQRARNCLKRLNIRTLGELVQMTETELLALKNFGETSLNEIKALVEKKGLRLGAKAGEADATAAAEAAPRRLPHVPPGQEAVLGKPVAEIELSVRARRCLQRLNVHTLGDLIQLTEADLLATRNFGQTSLNEVKQRLAEHGLQLAARKPV